MTLLIARSLTRAAPSRAAPPSEIDERIARRAKAVLSILRVRQLLDLTEDDLRFAVSVVLARELDGQCVAVVQMHSQYQTEELRGNR
ncbi:hypothetical protein HVL72_001987 [Escherichia coli]|nr:hypothetical protein [Escherichia coli]EHO8309540.1 hypothetical protein [Escherichia coli]MEB7199286.1 hypothetical protein [Escherichia coli]